MRNVKQLLANYSQSSVRDTSVSKLAEKYANVVERRKAEDYANWVEYEENRRLSLPHFVKMQKKVREELDKIAAEENANLPVNSVFEALQIVKAHKDIDRDIGLRALRGQLEKQWKQNRTANISVKSYETFVDYYKRNYPKSAVVDVLRKIGESGYAKLETSKLADLASEIHSQEDYERVVLEAGLQGNSPNCVKARNFIVAMVNSRTAQEEFEEEEEFSNEPEEEDFVIGPNGVSIVGGKFLGDPGEWEDTVALIVRQMNKDQFFPNVWQESDHGNYELLKDFYKDAQELGYKIGKTTKKVSKYDTAGLLDYIDRVNVSQVENDSGSEKGDSKIYVGIIHDDYGHDGVVFITDVSGEDSAIQEAHSIWYENALANADPEFFEMMKADARDQLGEGADEDEILQLAETYITEGNNGGAWTTTLREFVDGLQQSSSSGAKKVLDSFNSEWFDWLQEDSEEDFEDREAKKVAQEEFDSNHGKFENELAKKLYEVSLESGQDEEVGDSSIDTWAALFKPELAILYEDSQGFITVDEFEDEESLMKHWEMLEKELSFEDSEEDFEGREAKKVAQEEFEGENENRDVGGKYIVIDSNAIIKADSIDEAQEIVSDWYDYLFDQNEFDEGQSADLLEVLQSFYDYDQASTVEELNEMIGDWENRIAEALGHTFFQGHGNYGVNPASQAGFNLSVEKIA